MKRKAAAGPGGAAPAEEWAPSPLEDAAGVSDSFWAQAERYLRSCPADWEAELGDDEEDGCARLPAARPGRPPPAAPQPPTGRHAANRRADYWRRAAAALSPKGGAKPAKKRVSGSERGEARENRGPASLATAAVPAERPAKAKGAAGKKAVKKAPEEKKTARAGGQGKGRR